MLSIMQRTRSAIASFWIRFNSQNSSTSQSTESIQSSFRSPLHLLVDFFNPPIFKPYSQTHLNPYHTFHGYELALLERCWQHDPVRRLEHCWQQMMDEPEYPHPLEGSGG